MKSTFALVALLLAVAGCASGPAADAAEVPGPDASEAGAPRSWSFEHVLRFTRLSLHEGIATGVGLDGPNCLWLRTDLTSLDVTLEWTPRHPLDDLELIVHTDDGPVKAEGRPPLRLELRDLRQDRFFEGIGIIVQTDHSGLAYDVEARLAIESVLVDAGSTMPPVEESSCTWGSSPI